MNIELMLEKTPNDKVYLSVKGDDLSIHELISISPEELLIKHYKVLDTNKPTSIHFSEILQVNYYLFEPDILSVNLRNNCSFQLTFEEANSIGEKYRTWVNGCYETPFIYKFQK